MGMSGDTALTLAKNYVKKTLQGQGALKGQDGFSPIVTENKDNTNEIYKLDITTKDGTFTTPNLRGKDGESSGGGEANVIESISVNGTHISVDENKNVDITVPSIDGLAKTEDIPTKVSELTNDSGYLTEHQDISGKVDKVEGKSLISDTEIARLASVDNYDDTDIRTELANKADTTAIPSKVSELTNDSNYQTEEQVNSTVTTEIAKVVADAPEDLNTLKEMSDWIAGHEDDASAMNSAISDNKTAITALQKGKADKSEIPTTLPANGGNADTVNNHTVKSDVPENAVFTDTVYDDTEIKYGETAGGKNLFNGNFIEEVLDTGINYTDVDLSKEQNTIKDIKGIVFAVFGAYLKKGTYTFSYTNDAYFSLNRVAIAGTDCVLAIESIRKSYTWTQNTDGWTYFGIEGDDSETGVTDTPFSITPNIQIEKGTQATPYEPYIPSVKMLAEEVSTQNESLGTLEFGEVAGGKNICKALDNDVINGLTLIKKDVSTIIISGSGGSRAISKTFNAKKGVTYTATFFTSSTNVTGFFWNPIKQATVYPFGSSKTITFTPTEDETLSFSVTLTATVSNVEISMQIEEGSKSTSFEPYIPSVKMLAEEVNAQNDSLSVIGKCKNLLNPTLETTTVSGVTCTNNGDGTYTLNGTCTKDDAFILKNNIKINGSYRLVGCPKGEYSLWITSGYPEWVIIGEDTGNGSNFTNSSDFLFDVRINIYENRTYNNVVFKPMLTTNLSATYDDFVPYTGDGDTLTHDVAKVSDSLDAQGLLNKFDGDLLVGKVYASSDGSLTTNYTYVCNRNKIYCYENDIVHIRTKNTAQIIALYYNENKYISCKIVNSNQYDFIVPSGTTYMNFDIQDNTLSPSDIHIYINNEIEQIKNDLSVKKFELVAGVLWLCVSGKHCVLTLNGYNLTEPTHFDKLEEYQPYLVARNVVSNGDSVCIAAVEPNGNINASDLVVGTSLTGQLFGEISWIANI